MNLRRVSNYLKFRGYSQSLHVRNFMTGDFRIFLHPPFTHISYNATIITCTVKTSLLNNLIITSAVTSDNGYEVNIMKFCVDLSSTNSLFSYGVTALFNPSKCGILWLSISIDFMTVRRYCDSSKLSKLPCVSPFVNW